MDDSRDPRDLLDVLDLTEYEEQALNTLIHLGRTTAPDLADATGIPKARIYGVLDDLADQGYIKLIPGRPKEYQPKRPIDILEAAIETRRQSFETYRQGVERQREDFLALFEPIYDRAETEVSPTEELFYVVDVGDPSERETRSIYRDATEAVDVLTKSFEYFDSVEPAVAEALDRGLDVRVLFLDPELLESESNRDVQASIVSSVRETYPEIDARFSASRLPWRGTIADPSMTYDSGNAIVLVEEPDIPLHKRQAAVTENGSFVAGLERYFDLTWHHDTLDTDPLA